MAQDWTKHIFGMMPRWRWLCLAALLMAITAAEAHSEQDEDSEDVLDDTEDFREEPKTFLQVEYKTPVPTGDVYFAETFDDGTLNGWVLSKTVKEEFDGEIAKYDGKWEVEELKENKVPGDMGLVLKSTARHHAISSKLKKPFTFDKPLIVQYEINFQDGIDCGGAYIKLLSESNHLNLDEFHDRTPYTIMFGPDKCGEDYKVHFIFRHKNPVIGDYDEKHAKRPEADLKKYFTDKKTHLYTLIVKPDNTYEILIDQTVVGQGSLTEDVIPPLNPPKEIDDPKDKKPKEWDERAKIPDPNAVKPDDWDEGGPEEIEDVNAVKPEGWLDNEPHFILDMNAKKPSDWNAGMDGEWEPLYLPNPKCETAPGCGVWKHPIIKNPDYKGKWKPPLIENPNYQGIWKPHKIKNPHYFEDLNPFKMTPFSAVGLELWSMTSDIYFDNFIICSDKEVADRWASDSWGLKKLVASANEPSMLSQLLSAAEERPWLWVLYILTAALPVGLLVLFCWPRKKTEEKEEDFDFKLSDSCDENYLELQSNAKEEVEDGNEAGNEEYENSEDEGNEEDASVEEEEVTAANQSLTDDEIKESDESTGSGEEVKKSLRKRRVRKD
ncbi:calnexin isoform X1 [Xenopus laevis]|uniref:Calnexin isoform X1 n=4 Tax=Xenopus laevis TaxID=8355 RepID=A0A8J0U7D4_XENLA|nr:calnexin isoform X1 [Xenopus laevis]